MVTPWVSSKKPPAIAPTFLRLLAPLARSTLLISAALACHILTSCSTSKSTLTQQDSETLRLARLWQPHQMYLRASPHPRLYVEVDAVEGCSPSNHTLDKLRSFLTAHCQKPGGIEIARSDVIPLADALGVLPSALARKYINGPPENLSGPAPAFVYILFYDDVLSDRPTVAETGHVGARTAAHLRLLNRNPHVDVLPYPAMIYMNVHWSPKAVHDDALLHEAGHVLGLAFRTNNAADGHCLSRPCLMTGSVHLVPFLLGLDHGIAAPLCEQCLAQLAESLTQPPASNLRFVGPVLVRSERGYQVLALPHRAKVILGDLADHDCRDFAVSVHAETPSSKASETEWRVEASGKEEILLDLVKFREIVTGISADQDQAVRRVAPKLLVVCASRFNASGQFTDAVNTCRQAIAADPEEAEAYNLLGWIKATCPEPSVRDGKEAVASATKACQLSRWKDWNWIDTLAAACAEVGDFRQAVKFQERALRLSQPTASHQKEMRHRLLLYQQSQPFQQ